MKAPAPLYRPRVKLPTPQEMGLPEKFDRWRPIQEDNLNTILEYQTRKRFKALCDPTGSGKSAINVAAALLSGVPTAIVTMTKGLQDQYAEEFKSIGMVDLRGRNNYSCGMKETYTCEDGNNMRCPFIGTVSCPSSAQEMRATVSNLIVTNYSKWLADKKFIMGLSHVQQVIFDEGHGMPDALAKAMQVVLHYREIQEALKLDFPYRHEADDMWVWKHWAGMAKAKLDEIYNRLNDKIKMSSDPRPTWIKELTHLKNLNRRLSIIHLAGAKNWVVDETEEGYQFDPINPARYAESMLFMNIPSVIVVSATLREKTLHMAGILPGNERLITLQGSRVETENYLFEEYDSEFDPKDCPTYAMPVCDTSYQADLGPLFIKVDQWQGRRMDRKGIYHTISFARREQIMAASRYSHYMIFNERGELTTKKVKEFKESGPGSILVSPSISTGYDFPGDQCEHQVMFTIPFEPPSKILQAREANDPEYRAHRAVQYIVQGFGRDTRYKGDRGEGIMFDERLRWFWPRSSHHAPRSFCRTFKFVDTLPAPLEKL